MTEVAAAAEPQPIQPLEAETHSDIIKVHGELFTKLPDDLYIPPDALRVFLETFQGPLDLLLYLIKKQNIDIMNIPIVEITKQYVQYIELMQNLQLDLAGEYLVMAAMLAEIKSRLLLPRPSEHEEEEGEDPRAELIRRLQEYERFKDAAENLEGLPHLERDSYVASVLAPPVEDQNVPMPDVSLDEVIRALRSVLTRAKLYTSHQVVRETLSIRERMTIVLDKVSADEFIEFTAFFSAQEGRMGVVVTFIAILELIRQKAIELVQSEPFATIYVKAKG